MTDAETVLAALGRILAPFVAREVVRELTGNNGMLGQVGSPLGPRRHAAAVRRRVAEGKPGAVIAGRRLLLTREALDEELARLNARVKRRKAAKPTVDYNQKFGFQKI